MRAGETDTVPEVAPPVAKFALEHDVAFVEVHESAELAPEAMLVGEAANDATVAGGGTTGTTVTVAVLFVVPLPFVQL